MSDLLSSQVRVEEQQPQVRAIEGVPTSRTAFVGVTERGPFGATLVQNFDQFRRLFGGFTTDSEVPQSVEGFFAEGGSFAYVVRVVHHVDPADPSTKTSLTGQIDIDTDATSPTSGFVLGTVAGPFDLDPGDLLAIDVDGGGPVNATITATVAEVTTSNTETFALSDLQDLNVEVDGGSTQNVVFEAAEFGNIALASAAEVVDVMNAKLTGVSVAVDTGAVKITTDRQGSGASVQVTGGSANSVLAFPTTLQSGTGNVSDVDAVTVAEVKTIVEAAVSGLVVTDSSGRVRIASLTTGASSTIQVAAGVMQVTLGLPTATGTGGTGAAVPTLRVLGRYDGSYVADVQVRVSEASNKDPLLFNLSFVEDGLARASETFPNLNLTVGSARYAPTIVNADPFAGGSQIVLLEDLFSGVPDPQPAAGTFGPLAGGDDGLVGLVDADFVGGTSASGKTGLRVLDVITDVSILTVSGQATAVIHNAMITYVEITRGGVMFAVLDPPAGLTAEEVKTYVIDTALLSEITEFAAIYWPRILRVNPDTDVFGAGDNLVVPPSGYVAGIYSRVDKRRAGVFQGPAGSETGRIRTAVGVETDQVRDKTARDLLYPERINPISIPQTAPKIPFLDGVRTLKSTGPFPFIPQRRGTIFIETSVSRALEPSRFENITDRLRRSIGNVVKAFLTVLLPDDAFASQVAAEAFTIDVSEALNPPSSTAQGILIVGLGLAFSTPAEFIILRVGADQRALAAELGLEI